MASDTQRRHAAVATAGLGQLLRDWPSLAPRLAAADHQRSARRPLEDWLLQRTGLAGEHVAALRARAAGLGPADHGWLRVDAVSLQVSGDHLIALPWQTDDDADAAALVGQVLETLPIGEAVYGLEDCALIKLASPTQARFDPPWRAELRPVDAHLPDGPDGGTWRRWLTEAQMLLHQHPLNDERVARGRPPLNGLWLSGGAGWVPGEAADSVQVIGPHRLAASLPTSAKAAGPLVWSHRPGEAPPEALRWLESAAEFELEVLAGDAHHRFERRAWHSLRLWRREVPR